MSNVTQLVPASIVRMGIEPTAFVTVAGWTIIIERLTAEIGETPAGPALDLLVQQRFDALAAKDQAWMRRERACARLSA